MFLDVKLGFERRHKKASYRTYVVNAVCPSNYVKEKRFSILWRLSHFDIGDAGVVFINRKLSM